MARSINYKSIPAREHTYTALKALCDEHGMSMMEGLDRLVSGRIRANSPKKSPKRNKKAIN